jgi:hypothetical protein
MSSPTTITACPSCDGELADAYCPACGQRAPRAADFTSRGFAGDLWSEVSGADSRLWRTVLGLFRPGVLTRAWLEYRWARYLPPLRLYLLVSAAFFLLAWDVFFQGQVLQMRAAPAGAIPEAVRALYADPFASERISDWSAFYRFAGVLVLGLLVALLHWRKRLPVGRHLVFATHYYCADFTIFLLAAPLVAFAPPTATQLVLGIVTLGGMAWLGWWAILADHRVYGGAWGGSVVRGLLVLLADLLISVVSSELATASVLLRGA